MIRKMFYLVCTVCLLVAAGYAVWHFVRDETGRGGKRVMGYEKAVKKLDGLVSRIDWSENFVRRRAKVRLGKAQDLKETLPPIDRFEAVVSPVPSGDDVVAEIFTSTEKSGTGTDGIMVRIARDFNAGNLRLKDGRRVRVIIRKIASGTGYQFIASGKYRPDAFSPSSMLWVEMTAAHGVTMTPVRERMFGNIAGVVMKAGVADRLRSVYGGTDIRTLIDAVVQGNLVMGYTNPFASSTGLNFLITVLSTFAGGNPDLMLSPEVVSSFESFQRGVPFVALTTLQMRDSVENDGALEAFVMEYQTFANTPALRSGYEFIPFGIRHDNPLYAVGEIGPEKREVLNMFASFAGGEKYRVLAGKYGFDPEMPYQPAVPLPPGSTLVRAQKIWKDKKDAGRPIAAIFLCDVSGSMRGTRLNHLKKALIQGSEFIAPGNAIGVVLFNHRVSVVLPVKPFDLSQKAAFQAAVEDMVADGKTAMYDGVAVSLSMLAEARRKNPDVKPMLFVLTDGETNVGLVLENMSPIIEGLNMPIYTIGYEADIGELGKLSSLVEAASLNAGEAEIEYKIGSLLNAQM
ncbi:VWA domain-containing protein [Desulfonema ishimotonii]|uniref:VWA domain-containing protein n=1 Tax=Desulfonema ishimotonii TaxID=45657 RepID=A0A401G3Z1_9BACT|nr:VWA domain-containing protein [Desulfonema ishimotonii]GBC63934.1 VWA domain-containing protein [Desulfonema ishimotonii]